MIKRAALLGGGIVILLLASQLLLPLAAADLVEQAVTRLTGGEDVRVEVKAAPALKLLAGRFDEVRLRAGRARVDKLVFDDLNARISRGQVDIGVLLREKRFALQSAGDIELEAAFTQDELARCLNRSVKGVKNATVSITPAGITAGAALSLGGFASIDVSLNGRIVSDGDKISLATENFRIENGLAGRFGGSFATNIALFDLKGLPFAVRVRKIAPEEGRVVIFADNRGS